jgi:hypothetical protein
MSTDSTVAGIEGLNLKWEVPFKVDDYVVGFKYSLSEMKKAPQSLFAKRKFEIGDSSATVNADFNVQSKVLEVATSWASDRAGVAISALADSREMLKRVGASTSRTIGGFTLGLAGKYDMLKRSSEFSTKLSKDETAAEFRYNTEERDVVLSVSHDLDTNNALTPKISLTTGDVTYGWTRKWNGGSLASSYHPGDKAEFIWVDQGTGGIWRTKAQVPLEDPKKTKVSFTRDWQY